MRRLLILVSALVLVDAMLYSALTPLLPRFAHEFHLAKAASGALVGSYAAGALIGGLPGGRAAARLGPRRAVLVGLTLMGVSSIGFALAGDFAMLVVARVVQGAGSAFTWAGAFAWLIAETPPGRRGAVIGRAISAAVVGELLGPVIGVISGAVGRAAVFTALSALAVVLAVLTIQIDIDSSSEPVHVTLRDALGARRFTNGLWVMAVASMLVGVVSVLAPLHLAAGGWGGAAIGATWLLAAGLEACFGPFVGRVSDLRDERRAARAARRRARIARIGHRRGACRLRAARARRRRRLRLPLHPGLCHRLRRRREGRARPGHGVRAVERRLGDRCDGRTGCRRGDRGQHR